MKITPVAGTGVPGAGSVDVGRSVSPDKIARATAKALGQEIQIIQEAPREKVQESIKRIKMQTQRSTNRHDLIEQPVTEPALEEVPKVDPNEQAPKPEETRTLDPEKAALIKAKRALQVKERELQQREEALKTSQPATSQEDLIAKLKANPLNVLQEAGVTYEQLTEAILNNQNGLTPEIQTLRDELKNLKEEISNQLSTRDQQAEQQVLMEIDREVIGLTADGEQFEAIRAAKAQNQVTKLIHRVWQKGFPGGGPNGEDIPPGTVLDAKDAADYVENQLIEDALPFAKLKKLQSRIEPAPQAQAQTAPVQRPNVKVMRTLTNRDTAIPTMDRRTRAIMAAMNTLKKG